MYLLGYDIGSSSIKASLLDVESGFLSASATSPEREMEIISVRPGWAEQNPETWWTHVVHVTAEILAKSHVAPENITAIGISYQMHGLVVVDKHHQPLRPSIIWCDSRAVEIGRKAFHEIGEETCLRHFLNSPGNFTASKLRWVRENEPEIFARIHKAMLPGEYVAMKMTGEIATTPSGLSEGIMWDYSSGGIADIVLDHYDIPHEIIADVRPTFSIQGAITASSASELGLRPGIPVSYRAGDQPNNALSLKVINPGEVAATAGTSGVVYGVSDIAAYDAQSRVNPFVHVSHRAESPRYGVLMCINGTGILNSWMKHNCVPENMNYDNMNELARSVPAGSDGLLVVPFGNGAERTLGDCDTGAGVFGLRFNNHDRRHLLRASQEGIAFAFNHGLGIMREMGVRAETVRAGAANMFLSPVFREVFASVTGTVIELFNTDGSQGAARGAGIGAGIYREIDDAFIGLESVETVEPDDSLAERYRESFDRWKEYLASLITMVD